MTETTTVTADVKWLTRAALLEVIATEIKVVGEQQIAARAWGISPQYLCDVLNGRREPGAKLLKALGYRRVTIYEALR